MLGRWWAARICFGGSLSLFFLGSRWVGGHRVLYAAPTATVHVAGKL